MENYNFRPVDHALLTACATNDFCTNCTMRVGCPIRYNFYLRSDTYHEFALQMAELKSSKKFSLQSMPPEIRQKFEELTLEATAILRKKRLTELSQHTFFSYV